MDNFNPRQGALAFCGRNELGLITSKEPVAVSYPGGQKGLAWAGIHLSTEKFGQPWSSRVPRVVGVIRKATFEKGEFYVADGRGFSRAIFHL